MERIQTDTPENKCSMHASEGRALNLGGRPAVCTLRTAGDGDTPCTYHPLDMPSWCACGCVIALIPIDMLAWLQVEEVLQVEHFTPVG